MRVDVRQHAESAFSRPQYAALVEELRRTNREMNDFVRALAHDMGANLMLLECSAARLKRSLSRERSEEAEENLAHIEACLRQSRRLLDDMVELGRSGSLRMEPCRVELAAVVDEVLLEQRELLQTRGVQVHVERPLPVFWCNEDRLKQIVVNLVRNAVKHGCPASGGRITIAGVADETVRARKLAGFRVQDNGPGIAPRHVEDVFRPGWRAPGTVAEGSGMGLAIVRKIAGLYGGDAYVDTNSPGGTFVVRLPQARLGANSGRHPGHSPQPHNPKLGRPSRR